MFLSRVVLRGRTAPIRAASRRIQIPELSTFHSFWNTWPSVSLASTRKRFAPFGT
jgi:hypothetical protein